MTPTTATKGQAAELVADYLADCRSRGLSRNTIGNAYGFPLKRILLPFCEAEGIEEISQLDQRALNRLTNKLQDEGSLRGPLSVATVNAYMRSINNFLSWAKKDGQEVAGKANLPRLPERVIQVLSKSQIQAIEDAASNVRDGLIIRVLADTGIRVGELCKLRIDDVQHEGNRYQLLVRGKAGRKGEKERQVALSRSLYVRLRNYVETKRPKDADSDRVFFSVKKRAGGGYEPLTESGVQQMVRVLAERAGIKQRVHPHLFRHSFITQAIKDGGINTITLSRYVGHTTTRMIDTVYAHVQSDDAHKAVLAMLAKRDDGEDG